MEQEQQQQQHQQQQQDQHQNRRLRPPDQPENLNQQPQQPQKCPRCDSINTKFCYYNNYSLSQPRFFCKACRRYWTHGGTLRNVPVGGGCRKGKRPKIATSLSTSSSAPPPPPQTIAATANPDSNSKEFGNLTLPPPPAISPVNSYFSGGGFLSSVAAMQSMTQSQAFDQQLLNVGVGGGGVQFGSSSNLALLQGFSVNPSFGSRQGPNQQIQNPNVLFQMGVGNNRDKNIEPLYPSDQSLVQQSNRPLGPWNQNLMINTSTNPTTASNPTPNPNPNPSFINPAGTSMNPNQWPDLHGFDSPM